MAILTMQYVPSYASDQDFLEGFRDFALARGWTIDDYQRDVVWQWTGSQYEWQPGNESYLKLHSAGFGFQQLNYKIRLQDTSGAHDDYEHINVHGHTDATFPDNPAVSTHPADYQYWDYGNVNSIHPTNIGPVWFFGNNYFLMAMVRCTCSVDDSRTDPRIQEAFFSPICIGTIELFDITTTEGMFNHVVQGTYSYEWNYVVPRLPFDMHLQYYFYHFGQRVQTMRVDCRDPRHGYSDFLDYSRLMDEHPSKPERYIYQPTIYLYNPGVPAYVPLGKAPIFRCSSWGLEPGEIIDKGSSRFIVFPNGYRLFGYYGGMAVQIG